MDFKKALNKIIGDMFDEDTLWVGMKGFNAEAKIYKDVVINGNNLGLLLFAEKKRTGLITDTYTFELTVCKDNSQRELFIYELEQKSDLRTKPFTCYGEKILEESKHLLLDNESGKIINELTLENREFIDQIANDLIDYAFYQDEEKSANKNKQL